MKSLALLFKLSLRNVLRNRRRSFYALATIAIGAMGLILFTGFNRGLMKRIRPIAPIAIVPSAGCGRGACGRTHSGTRSSYRACSDRPDEATEPRARRHIPLLQP